MTAKKLSLTSFQAFVLAVLFLVSCGKDDPSPATVQDPDIYLAGIIGQKPGYLKNDEEVVLSPDNGSVEFIDHIGSDIYAVGFTDTYKIWKNGIASEFPDAIATNHYYGFDISGSDLYLIGTKEYADECPPEILCGGPRPHWTGATIWKNGVASELAKGEFGATANASAWDIEVVGSDIYVSGAVNATPVYWKNGVLNKLSVTDCGTPVYAIAVQGADVYTATNCTYGIYYWKNDEGKDLTNLSKINSAGAIDADDDNVYLAGSVEGAATLWKNGEATTIPVTPKAEDIASVSCLKVYGGNAYILIRKGNFYVMKNDSEVANYSGTSYTLTNMMVIDK